MGGWEGGGNYKIQKQEQASVTDISLGLRICPGSS